MDASRSTALSRRLGPRSAVMITVGAMVGSGIFATPHDVAVRVASPTATIALWIAGALLALLGAVCFAELGASIPESGGMYHYLRRAFGPFVAFAFAWAMLTVLVPSSVGYFAEVTAEHLAVVVALPARSVPWLSAGVIVALVGVNLVGVRAGAGVQNAATIVKYGGIVALGLAALFAAGGAAHVRETTAHASSTAGLLAALVPVLWAYDGWVDVTSIAGEIRDPARNLPRSLVLGTALVTALYLVANAGYLALLGTSGLAHTDTPASAIAAHLFGRAGGALSALLVAVSTFGGCAVALLTGSRVVFAMAAEGKLFAPLARLSRAEVPILAVAVCGALALAYLSSRVASLAELFVLGAWPFYAVGAIAVPVLRLHEPALERPYRVPFYPAPVVLFVLGAGAVVVAYAITQPKETAISLGIVALAVPVHLVARRRR